MDREIKYKILSGGPALGVDLHGRMNPQSPLKAGEIVIGNVLPDHSAQLLPAGKPSAIIALPLKDAPEALHWAIVNALTYSGHALGLSLIHISEPTRPP